MLFILKIHNKLINNHVCHILNVNNIVKCFSNTFYYDILNAKI